MAPLFPALPALLEPSKPQHERKIAGALGVVAALAVILTQAGCSGADHQDLFGPATAQTDVVANDPVESETARDTTPPPAPTNVEPKPEPKKDEPTQPEKPSCVAETEPNNSLQNANAFATCISGKLDGASDVDVVRISTIPNGAKFLSWRETTGDDKLNVRLLVNGVPLGAEDDVPVQAGGTYAFSVRGQNNRAWEINVAFR